MYTGSFFFIFIFFNLDVNLDINPLGLICAIISLIGTLSCCFRTYLMYKFKKIRRQNSDDVEAEPKSVKIELHVSTGKSEWTFAKSPKVGKKKLEH